MTPVFTVDATADAGYVALHDAPVSRTVHFGPSVLIDLDSAGSPVGIEILTLAAGVDIDSIAERYGIPDEVREQLSELLTRLRS